MNFWQELKNKKGNDPIFCLAPMADVTDAAFRFIIAKYSKQITPHFSKGRGEPLTYVTYTEFVSADGLVLAPEEGREKLLKNLQFSEIERPIVAQFFTSKPEMMEKAASLAVELGFDGVDINMGCPDKKVEKQGAGARLMKNPKLAREIILAAKQGAGDLPVSVKTRIGFNKNEIETWLPALLETRPAAITIHARTRKEMSLVPAQWEVIKRAVEIRDHIQNFSTPQPQKCTDIFLLKNSSCSPQSGSQGISKVAAPKSFSKTLIIGNGDVTDIEDGRRKCTETGADGAMLGRAVFGNPWLFSNYEPTVAEKLQVLAEHIKIFDQKLGDTKSFAVMKKHFKAYINGFDGAKELRTKLMETENAQEVAKILADFRLPIQ